MIRVRPFSRQPYAPTHQAMREFTASRAPDAPDEIWLVEHPPVFTQGLAGKAEHLLSPGEIPVVQTERGGQVTYHGPGQVVAYLMLDLRRMKLGVRDLVCRLEQTTIALAADRGVKAVRRDGAPGVYIASDAPREADAKLASLGLKLSRGCTFHGIALNVAMDLEPFSRINPCGYAGLCVTDLSRASARVQSPAAIAEDFGRRLSAVLAH